MDDARSARTTCATFGHMVDPSKPFLRSDALASGISAGALAGRQYVRIFHKVHISAGVRLDREHRFAAGLLAHPSGAWISHTSAAALRGVAVPDDPDVHVSVVDAKDRRWSPGLKPHVAPVGTEVVVCQGIRVSGIVRMFVELAAVLPLVDLVVAGDSMCRVLGIKAAWLRSELEKTRDYWSAAARYAAQFVRDRVDSPMETRTRMLLVLAGFPEPTVNFEIRDENGDVVLQFDLAYEAVRVAVEFHGRHHVEVIASWERDLERQDVVDDARWRVVSVTASGVYVDPLKTLDRVARALRSRGMRVPRSYDPEWMRHFPGRRRAS